MIQFSTWSLYHNILNISDAEKEAEDDEEEDILKQMDDFIKNWYKKNSKPFSLSIGWKFDVKIV